MNITIEKIIALIIFLVILLALIFFSGIPQSIGRQINLQQELRECCQAYIGNNCDYSKIANIICNEKFLEDIVNELNMNEDSLRSFCMCPE